MNDDDYHFYEPMEHEPRRGLAIFSVLILLLFFGFAAFAAWDALTSMQEPRKPLNTLQELTTTTRAEYQDPLILTVPNIQPREMPPPVKQQRQAPRVTPVFPRDSQFSGR